MFIPRRKEDCILDGKKMVPSTDCISLIWNEQGIWHREDYCYSCWKNAQKEKNLKPSSCFWKITIPAKLAKTPVKSLQKGIDLFIDLAIHGNDEKLQYVLALYLERKKQLHKRQEIKNTKEHFIIYEFLSKEETFTVKPIPLSEEEIRLLYDELINRFYS